MAELHDPVETGMPKRVQFSIIAVIAFLVVIWLLPRAAKKGDVSKTKGPAGSPTAPAAAKSSQERECERRLDSILSGLHPEFVVVSTERRERVHELGQWAADCMQSGDAAAIKIDEAANQVAFTGEALKDVSATGFSLRDGHHITLARLAGDIATPVSRKTTDPAEQANELFQFVIRQTQLVPDDMAAVLPATPFESLLIGRSTAANRAWTFAVLLRQLRLDAVILEPKSKPNDWIVGVLLPGKVHLYDMRLGTPFPSTTGPNAFDKPGTLADVLSNPALLRELDSPDFPYPLQPDDLKSLSVRLITDSTTSSLRMAKLQTKVSGSLMELFDGLGNNPLRDQGLIARVTAAGKDGGWTERDVAVWVHPEKQSEAFMNNQAESAPEWKTLTAIFAGPLTVDVKRRQARNENEDTTVAEVTKSKTPLRLVRIMQLEGQTDDAIKKFGPIRQQSRDTSLPPDPVMRAQLLEARPLNLKDSDFATFWIALCQYDSGRTPLVPDTLQSYIRDFLSKPGYKAEIPPDALAELWARALADSGKPDEAVALLKSGRSTPRLAFLLKRIQAKAKSAAAAPAATPPKDAPTSPAAETPPQTPADPDRPPAPPAAAPL